MGSNKHAVRVVAVARSHRAGELPKPAGGWPRAAVLAGTGDSASEPMDIAELFSIEDEAALSSAPSSPRSRSLSKRSSGRAGTRAWSFSRSDFA